MPSDKHNSITLRLQALFSDDFFNKHNNDNSNYIYFNTEKGTTKCR